MRLRLKVGKFKFYGFRIRDVDFKGKDYFRGRNFKIRFIWILVLKKLSGRVSF